MRQHPRYTSNGGHRLFLAQALAWFCVSIIFIQSALGQGGPPAPGVPRAVVPVPAADPDAGPAVAAPAADDNDDALEEDRSWRLKFDTAPLELLLKSYAEATGRTMLLAPSLPAANVTLRSQTDLTLSEYLDAIETVLGMHGVALLREGDRFLRVVPNKDARKEPMRIRTPAGDASVVDSGKMISQLIPLKHIEIAEAQKAVESLKHVYGTVDVFESINSILVTDTAATINRVLEMIGYIDQPILAREEPNIIQIRYAKASDIKNKLLEIITEAQKDQKTSTVPRQNTSGAPGATQAATANRTPTGSRTVPAVIRAARPTQPAAEASQDVALDEADRGLIRGDVKIIEDDRTNILILITRPENMPFFETIIKVLDVETGPDVMVQIYRLEYAESKDIATMLNELIGVASAKDKDAPAIKGGDAAGESGEAAALRDYVARQAAAKVVTENVASKVGELSKENVKILSDDRTNALIIMASKSDHVALREIIKDMDTMLSQVLIETVILEINLGDSMDTGVSWVQRALLGVGKGANGARKPIVGWAGSGGGGNAAPVDPTGLTSLSAFPGASPVAGLTYYLTMFDINVDAVIQAVASDSRAKLLSSPVIVTTDNTPASIDVSTVQYFFKGKKYTGSQNGDPIYEDDVERESVGINLNVTPRINEKKFVVMEIKQKIENVIGVTAINGVDWPLVSSRELEAEVSVRNGGTIVMGGLIQNRELKSRSKVPILGDIPILGIPFRADSRESGRTELIVFITPYVLDTPEDIIADTRRRQGSMHAEGLWKKGWSNSQFAEPQDFGPYDEAEADSPAEADATRAAKEDTAPRRRAQPSAILGPEIAEQETAAAMDSEPVKDAGKYSEWDPLAEIDDELRAYILAEDKKWQGTLERMDEKFGNANK